MPVTATDNFEIGPGAFASDITVYSTDWSYTYLGAVVATDTLYGDVKGAGEVSISYWSKDTFDNDQYSVVLTQGVTNGVFLGPAVRCASSDGDCYLVYFDCDAQYMKRIDNGIRTAMGGTGTDGIDTGHTVYIEANGTSIKTVVNDTDSPIGTQTDATYSTGYAGVNTYSISIGGSITAWEGGTLGAAPAENYLPGIAHRHIMTLRGS